MVIARSDDKIVTIFNDTISNQSSNTVFLRDDLIKGPIKSSQTLKIHNVFNYFPFFTNTSMIYITHYCKTEKKE